MALRIGLIIFILFIIYLVISYILLDGRLIYTTSFCSTDIADSKKRNLFISDNLKIKLEPNSPELYQLLLNNNIWIERHYDVNYYGILFHLEKEQKDFRKIRFNEKNIYLDPYNCCTITIENDTIERHTGFPFSQMSVRIGSTVKYNIYKCKSDSIIGKLSIKIDK